MTGFDDVVTLDWHLDQRRVLKSSVLAFLVSLVDGKDLDGPMLTLVLHDPVTPLREEWLN